MEASVGLAGQTAGLIDEIKPVKQIIDETITGFREICGRMAALEKSAAFG